MGNRVLHGVFAEYQKPGCHLADIIFQNIIFKRLRLRIDNFSGLHTSYQQIFYGRMVVLKLLLQYDILDVEESAVSDKVSLGRGEVVLMGIETEEFGKTAYMPDGILDKHWYHYLNDMAKNPYGVLMSSNARDKLGLSIGDSVAYTRFDEENRTAGMGKGVIVGFVDYFPGFSGEKYVKNSNGSYTLLPAQGLPCPTQRFLPHPDNRKPSLR